MNLCVCCSGCHKNIHEGRLRVKGEAPEALEFTDSSGKPLVRPVDLPAPPELISWVTQGASTA